MAGTTLTAADGGSDIPLSTAEPPVAADLPVHHRPLPAETTAQSTAEANAEVTPAAHGPPHPDTSSPTQRDAFFDNAKYLAIVLVALGHFWEPLLPHSRIASALYAFVYTFHMPAFTVVSGYFSRSFEARPYQLKRLLTGVALPYVVFETAYSLFKRWTDDDPSQPISLLDPIFLTWFLAALFVWRLTAPLWKLIRWPVPIALGIAVLASITPDIGNDLDLQRTLQFLPFFVVGLCLRREHFDLLHRRAARLAAVPVALVALAVAYWSTHHMTAAWLFHRDSAQELDAPWWTGIVMTLALFGCSMLLTACFLAWVPRRRMWFTVLGAGTLYGYLLHGFLEKGPLYRGWFDAHWTHTPWGEIGMTAFAVTAVTALCTPPVRRAFRFVMEPRMAWAFRQDPVAAARHRAGGDHRGRRSGRRTKSGSAQRS